MSSPAFYYGTGRRKTAIARVRLLPGEGEIVVNGRTLGEHFGNAVNEAEVRMPFRVTGTEGRWNVMIKVEAAVSPVRPARSATGSPARSCSSTRRRTAWRCARQAFSPAIRG
jgi:hypothetical protein